MKEPGKIIEIDFTNYKGIRSWRLVQPVGIQWGITDRHVIPQYTLMIFDVEDDFAVKSMPLLDIHDFREPSPARLQKYSSQLEARGL